MPDPGAFVVCDVETANSDLASICQVGIAKFQNGELVDEWVSYVDPQAYFDPVNIAVHGIDEEKITQAPRFDSASITIRHYLESDIAVCHTPFDRTALARAAERHGLIPFSATWLDSARVARKAWVECSQRGYGLSALCAKIGYRFRHHDALEDAKAAGFVLLAAIDKSGIGIDEWVKLAARPIRSRSIDPINPTKRKLVGNPDGPLYGETVVFTGSLSIPRAEAARLAAELGCNVATSVTTRTTILAVGGRASLDSLTAKKSGKRVKAEALARDGHQIRIIDETDFFRLIDANSQR